MQPYAFKYLSGMDNQESVGLWRRRLQTDCDGRVVVNSDLSPTNPEKNTLRLQRLHQVFRKSTHGFQRHRQFLCELF